MNRFWKAIVGAGVLAVAGLLAGCNDTGPAQALYTNVDAACPVSPAEMQNVVRGAYGVDAFSRPVNHLGYPIDVNGNCINTEPASQVWYTRPAPIYVNYYSAHWGVWYAPTPIVIVNPGVFVYRTGVPSGRYVPIHNYVAPPRTVVSPVGPQQTVRPGAGPAVIVPGGAPQTVRPVTPGVAPAVSPVKPAAPIAAPAAPAVAPVKPSVPAAAPVAPAAPQQMTPAGGARSSIFNRPAAVAPAAPPPRQMTSPGGATSRTFVRPPSSSSGRRR